MPEEPSVLLAKDLAPADTALLDPSRVLALVTSQGGPTSHTAIIARRTGLPCVVAAPVDDIESSTVVLVNGGNGDIVIDPDPDEAKRLVAIDEQTRAAASSWNGPGRDR